MIGIFIQFIEWAYTLFWKEENKIEPIAADNSDISDNNPPEGDIEKGHTGQMGGSNGTQAEASSSSAPPAPIPERVVLLYAFGALQPALAIPENSPISKYSLCTSFKQSTDQIVYIFRDATLIHMFPGNRDDSIKIRPAGTYFVIFQQEVEWYGGVQAIKVQQTLMVEMMEFETKKGELRNPSSYPNIAEILKGMEKSTSSNNEPSTKNNRPIPSYYKFGAKEPALQGVERTQKIIICALFGESIYQDVKIFFNSTHHQTIANCFEMAETTKPGKYVIIFETDEIHSRSNKEIERELKRIEVALAEEKKQEKKKIKAPKKPTVVPVKKDPSNPEGEIHLYGFGETRPKKILSQKGAVTKKSICTIFGQILQQEVHIYRGSSRIHSFLAWEDTSSFNFDYGSYTIVFQFKGDYGLERHDLEEVKYLLVLMDEMAKFEKQKGDLRCVKTYPAINSMLKPIEEVSKTWENSKRCPVFYRVGERIPVIHGPTTVMKIVLCALFKESIYQGVKIFYNNRLYLTLFNCFERVSIPLPGKYIVAFECDTIYSMTATAASNELEQIEQRFLEEEKEKQKKLLLEQENRKKLELGEDQKRTKKEEESKKEVAKVFPPAGEIRLYGFGDIKPTQILFQKGKYTKRFICSVFGQILSQGVQIYQGSTLIQTFPKGEDDGDVILDYGTYTVVFPQNEEICKTQLEIQCMVEVIEEMKMCERQKDNLRCVEKYPRINAMLDMLQGVDGEWNIGNNPNVGLFNIGGSSPVLQGTGLLLKIELCAVFKQSIDQEVKVFYNNRLTFTASNHLGFIFTPVPGKYFESDLIYHMPEAAAGKELEQIEQWLLMEEEEKHKNLMTEQKKQEKLLLEEERKRKQEDEERNRETTTSSLGEIRLYGYGDIKPTKILTRKGKYTKRVGVSSNIILFQYICSYFDQQFLQEVQIYGGSLGSHIFSAGDENGEVFLDYDTYIVVFQLKDNASQSSKLKFVFIPFNVAAMIEALKYEKEKGDLRCTLTYPIINVMLQNMELERSPWDDDENPDLAFYGVRSTFPVLRGVKAVKKLLLCLLFNQNVYQNMKIFYNNKLYCTVSNCFDFIRGIEAGKYIVVFESDDIFAMSTVEAEKELERMEQELVIEKEQKGKLLMEQDEKKKKRAELERSQQKSKKSDPPAHFPREIQLYGYGDVKPTHIIPEKVPLNKKYICSLFGQQMFQNVHIFRGAQVIYTFETHDSETLELYFANAAYTVVFQSQYPEDDYVLCRPKFHLGLMSEMSKFESQKGDLRCEKTYPLVNYMRRELKTLKTCNNVSTTFYRIGENVAILRGIVAIMKMLLCILCKQSIYQGIKIFHNGKFFTTLTNCFEIISTPYPGKYVIVFESDFVYNMPTTDAENVLERLEHQLLEKKNRKAMLEKSTKSIALAPEQRVRIYGFGEIEPTLIDEQKRAVSKKLICTAFEQLLPQEIHVYRGDKRIHTFPAHDDHGDVFLDYGSYTIIFQMHIERYEGLDNVENYLTMKEEIEKYGVEKGDVQSEQAHPTLNKLLRPIREHSKIWASRNDPHPAFYGVGASFPVIRGIQSVMKIALCALLNQSIYQKVKIFYKSRYYATVSECFQSVVTPKPGKYVVVFENDAIYSMPTAEAEKELERIEDQLAVEKEHEKRNKAVSESNHQVYLYGYGCLEPRLILETEDTIDKYILCIVFGQHLDQNVYLFNKNRLIRIFARTSNGYTQFKVRGRFTVVFDEDLLQRKVSLERVESNLEYLHEMFLCEKKKGDLRSRDYPFCCSLLKNIEMVSKGARGKFSTSFSRVGTKESTIYGLTGLNKMYICMYYNQSIYQDVKVFHNYRHLATLTDCFTYLDLFEPGKYVAVFKTDAIYNKSDDEIGEELRKMDPDAKSVDELAEEFRKMDEEKRKKTEKNNKKKAKKKEKKLLQQKEAADSKSDELGQQSSKADAPSGEADAGCQDNDTPSTVAKKKKGKKQKKAITEDAEERQSDHLSDSEEPAVAVENKFASLQFLEKLLPKSDVLKSEEPVDLSTVPEVQPFSLAAPSNPPTIGENEATSSVFQEYPGGIDDHFREILTESIPFEKPKIYARNKNTSFSWESTSKADDKQPKSTNLKARPDQKSPSIDTMLSTSSGSHKEVSCSRSSYAQKSDRCTEEDSSIFEEIPTKPLDGYRGAKAVVVGIHQRGLIVQTLPPLETDSEYLLLDYCSQCTTSGRSLTDVSFNTKVLHVYLKVMSVAILTNDPIINENETQKGSKIEKRVAEYTLDMDTYTRGRFERGHRDSIDEELNLKKKERKIIALIVETNEEDKADIVRVVGPPSHLSFLAQLDKTRMRDEYSPLTENIYFHKEEFIMADSFQADPFFKLHIMFDTLCLVKSYAAEDNFNQLVKKMDKMYLELQKCLRAEETNCDSILLKNFPHNSDPPNGDTFLFNIEKLDTKQEHLIETCCKELAIKAEKMKKKGKKKGAPDDQDDEDYDPEELYNQFRLYLRDPALTICRLNSYYAFKNSLLYTIKTKARLTIERAELCIVIELDHAQVNQVLHGTKNRNSWMEGGQLKLINSVLRRQRQTHFGPQVKSDADLVIDEIRQWLEPVICVGLDGQPYEIPQWKARVRLMPAKNSKDIFDIIQEYPSSARDFAKELSQIGPAARDGASETLATGLLKFKTFYMNPRFFNWWRGYRDADSPENVDYLNILQNEIEIPNGRDPSKPYKLDRGQSLAYQHSFYRDGITSISAGPGSGKTLLSAGLIIKCHKDRMDERMIVTATTNEGVDNAVEKIIQLSPGFPVTREMGKKGDITVREEIKEHTLRYQALESEQTNPTLLNARKEYRKVLKYYNETRNLRDKLNRLEILHYAESRVKRTYLRTIIPFCGASTPALLVRHADHYNVVINDDNEEAHRHWPIKHMIVDEASQLPFYTALALCCSFPYLERITIMGDRQQLGPHCVLQSHNGLLSFLCRLSELDRINGLRTVEEYYLRMNYRSHLWIVENLEQPHYGSDFQSGLAPTARTLAYTLDLPLFKIRSKGTARPVAFINIAPGDDCQNASERDGVLKLLQQLMEKGVSPTGISILCFHRKQKEEMEKRLKPRFVEYKMRDFVSKLADVHTIDSFQGRENDIIIVCTTKTVGSEGLYYRGIFSFVSDPRRGLVAVSRAKEAMYVFGQWQYLQRTPFWKDKVALMKREKLMYDEDFNEM